MWRKWSVRKRQRRCTAIYKRPEKSVKFWYQMDVPFIYYVKGRSGGCVTDISGYAKRG